MKAAGILVGSPTAGHSSLAMDNDSTYSGVQAAGHAPRTRYYAEAAGLPRSGSMQREGIRLGVDPWRKLSDSTLNQVHRNYPILIESTLKRFLQEFSFLFL